MYFLILFPPVVFLIILFIGFFISAPVYKGPVSDHFDGKVFRNYDQVEARGFLDVIKWMFNRENVEWKKVQDASTKKPANTQEDSLTIYFINHATFLIQWRGLNILTDPVWSDRTSPFNFAGPERVRPPGILFNDLPKIDLVIISHSYYDHLDISTIEELRDRDQPVFIVPLGVDLFLKNKGIKSVKAIDWWQYINDGPLKFSMVPALHFSGRGMSDRDKTLWAGYMISDGNQKIYFAGDTGYNHKMFADIAKQHSDIDIAMLPIGAYKPRWLMSPIHISPEEAVVIHQQLNCKKSIAMHYGTFPMADDRQQDASEDLQLAIKKHNIGEKEFLLLNGGDKFNLLKDIPF